MKEKLGSYDGQRLVLDSKYMGKFYVNGGNVKYVLSKNEFLHKQLKCENGSLGVIQEENIETPFASEDLDFDQIAKTCKMPLSEIHIKLLEI